MAQRAGEIAMAKMKPAGQRLGRQYPLSAQQ
jgi:hypothetical protein